MNKKRINSKFRCKIKIKEIWVDESGGSMLESGLLIALSLILFLMLLGMITNVYQWIDEQFQEVIQFFLNR